MLLGDAVPFVAEQYHGSPRGRLEARECNGALSEFDGHNLPPTSALLVDPAVLARADPVDARSSVWTECVAALERGPVMVGVGDGEAGADGIAGPEEGSEVGLKGDPERGDQEVIPAAMAAAAAGTTDPAGSRLVGAQRARATAPSSIMQRAYSSKARPRLLVLNPTSTGLYGQFGQVGA